jgi:putative inorganic carbon (hco3(-)) transporter
VRTARIIDRAIFCSVLALFPLASLPFGGYAPHVEGAFESLVFSLGALWVVEGALRGGWQVRGQGLLYPVLGIAAIAFVQTLPLSVTVTGGAKTAAMPISADPYETKLFILKLLALALVGALLMQYTSGRGRLLMLLCVIVGVGVASALFGLGRQVMQHGATLLASHAPAGEAGFGQFANRNHFAFLMEMTFGLALGLTVAGGWRRGQLLIGLAAVALMWAALVRTGSRGGLLGMAAQVLFLVLTRPAVRPRAILSERFGRVPAGGRGAFNLLVTRGALAACLLTALGAGVLLVGGESVADRFHSVKSELAAQDVAHRTYTRRLEIWQGTARLIRANLVAGVGFGGYEAAIPLYHDATGEFRLRQAHNDYLELIAGGGLVAGVLGACFATAWLVRARSNLARAGSPIRRAARLGSVAGVLGVAVHSFVDFGLHIFVNALIFTALAVVAASSVASGSLEELPS